MRRVTWGRNIFSLNSQSRKLAAVAHIFCRRDNKLYTNRLFLALVILIYLEFLGFSFKPPPFCLKNNSGCSNCFAIHSKTSRTALNQRASEKQIESSCQLARRRI
jgi:hypothetical protein